MNALNTKSISVGDIFDLNIKTNSSNFTKSFIQLHKGNIPVFSASKSKNAVAYGYVEDNLKGVRYFKNCLTWNIDGSIGKSFFREGKFSLSEKVIPLILKNEYSEILYYPFLEYALEEGAKNEGFSFSNKAGKSKIRNITIKIPVDDKGYFDLKKQKEIASKYLKINNLREEVISIAEDIAKTRVEFPLKTKFDEFPLIRIFDFKSGNSKYTKTYILKNKGKYPIYSANTKQEGLFGNIDSFDFDCECLQLTTNGVYAGTIFHREKHKFSINGDARLLIKKYNDLDYIYLLFQIRESFLMEGFSWENKPSLTKTENITIKIPVDDKGYFDLKKQKEIASKYLKIEKIKNNIKKEFKEIIKLKFNFLEE